MIRKLALGLMAFGLLAAAPAMAASDVSSGNATNNPAQSQVAVSGTTAPAAATQTAGLIAGAASNAVVIPPAGGGGVTPAGVTPAGGTPVGNISLMNSRDAGRAGGAGDKKFGAWLQGAYTSVDNTQAGLQFDGDVFNLVGGLDYMVNDRVVVGLALGYETLDLTTTFNAGTIEADGFGISPYIGVALNKTWSWDAVAGYTWLNYDTTRNSNAVRGSFDATRWFVASNLTGNYAMGRWRLMPKVGVLYLEEKADAYADSTGGTIGSVTTKLGRVSAGARFGYAFNSVMPYVKIMGEYDFEKNGPVRLANGTFSNDDDMGAQLGLGFDFYGSNTFSGNVEAAYLSAGRADLDVWTATARLRVKF